MHLHVIIHMGLISIIFPTLLESNSIEKNTMSFTGKNTKSKGKKKLLAGFIGL